VGLKPSASQGEARLRGLYWIIYSKTIISVYALPETGVARDTADMNGVNVSEKCCNPVFALVVELMEIENYSSSHRG